MTKEDYFYEAFQGMERLGPGSRESTEKALAAELEPIRSFSRLIFRKRISPPLTATALISKRLTRVPLPAASPIGFTVWRCPCLI